MSLTEGEIERLRLRAWKNRAKGKGIRWRMIRDTLATVSVSWMTLWEVQMTMIRLWGLTRKKTRELLEEMVELGDVQLEKDEKTYEMKYHLNPERATYWLGPQGATGIPAGLVEAVAITRSAAK